MDEVLKFAVHMYALGQTHYATAADLQDDRNMMLTAANIASIWIC